MQMGEDSSKMRAFLLKLTINAILKAVKMSDDYSAKTEDSAEKLKAALYVAKMMNVKDLVVAAWAPDGIMASYEPYQCFDLP